MLRHIFRRSFSAAAAATRLVSAAVARSPSAPLTIETLELRAPRQDEIVVKVVATGLCHTDIAVKERDLCAFPMVLGHEGVGVVEEVGASVSTIAPGDRVLMSFGTSCCVCFYLCISVTSIDASVCFFFVVTLRVCVIDPESLFHFLQSL
jgi:Zn-dependent alcohol dehydrogenase